MKLTRRSLMKWLGGAVASVVVAAPVVAKAAAIPRPPVFRNIKGKFHRETLIEIMRQVPDAAPFITTETIRIMHPDGTTEYISLAPKVPWVAAVERPALTINKLPTSVTTLIQ